MIGVTTALEHIAEIKAKETAREQIKEEDEWDTIRVPKNHIPRGARLIEAYETEREIIVLGEPPDDEHKPEEEQHNCDAMGCGSLSHVLYRFEKGTK